MRCCSERKRSISANEHITERANGNLRMYMTCICCHTCFFFYIKGGFVSERPVFLNKADNSLKPICFLLVNQI